MVCAMGHGAEHAFSRRARDKQGKRERETHIINMRNKNVAQATRTNL